MIIRNLQVHFGAKPGNDVLAECNLASADILAHQNEAYKLIIPSGDYYLSDTWEIPNAGWTVIVEGEVGSGYGTLFRPDVSFKPVVTLGSSYIPFVRRPAGLHDSFTTPNEPGWTAPGFNPAKDLHRDYRALIRLRGMGEGSAFRGIAVTGRDKNKVARAGKGIWIDGLWFNNATGKPDDTGYDEVNKSYKPGFVFYGSNGLLIDSCKVNGVNAVLEDPNQALSKETFPWLPAIAVQVGSASTDTATRQVSNTRIHRSYVFGALGPATDPFHMRTDLGIFFVAGNMKNYMVSECNIGFCRYGVRTAGSGYTNVIGCDFAANGSGREQAWWPDGADFLVPQAQVSIIGCGSEGSRRLVQGDGAPNGFGALDIDACYFDGILPIDLHHPTNDDLHTGYVIRNLNQAGHIRGLRVVTGGSATGRAGRAAIQIHGIVRSLVVVNSHIEGVAQQLGDPLIYDSSDVFIPPLLGEVAPYDNENIRIVVQNCTSRGYSGAAANQTIVPLQNYDFSGVKRIGGNSFKVTLVEVTPLTTPLTVPLEAWHHTIVADASQGTIIFQLPHAKLCRGREYVIKRLDKAPPGVANAVQFKLAIGDALEGKPIQHFLNDLHFCKLVSGGDRGWVLVGQ